ncbi:MAG TPA: hypothetical protein VGW74_01015 [Propionibacteriaceae bacterium]|nr:hypothetical protein [Propionibacteriaceae bacterium]
MIVIAAVVVTALITIPLTYLVARRPRPVMPHRQRVLLNEAMALLWQFTHPTDLDRLDMLSIRSKEAAEELLTKYQKETK